MLDVGRRSCDIPLTKQLTALRRARSLRDPVTSSSRKFSASIVNSSWESPACKSESVRDGTNEDEHGCNNQFVSASSREEAGKLMGSKREEKNELSSKGSGVLNWDLTNVKHAQDCEREMEEPSINSSERLVTRENVSKRRDNNKGEKSLLHNWRNERHNDEADEFVESGAESKERDLIKNERRGQFRRHQSESHGSGREEEHNSVEIQGEERRTTMKQGRRGRSFKKTLSSCRKDSVSRKSITSLSSALSDEAPAGALSLLSLEEDEPCAVTHFCNGENDVGFSRMRRDCASQSGSPLLMSDALKSREQKAKCNKKRHSSSISKYIGRQKDDSHTPTSICSFNRNDDCKSSMRGSCDGTAFSGDDEMDGLDVPRHGCGIPCYWSRTPKHRSKSFLDCAGWSLPHGLADTVRRKGGNMPSRNKTCSLKDSTLHACNSKRSVHKLNFDMEALPLLTDEGESAELSGEDGSDEPYDDFGELFLEDDAELGRRISRHRRREKLELALTSESRELTVYADTHRSLSQKYRPRAFDEMVGQNMVVQSLVNAVLKGKVAPVYLFQGPRGTGKTSTARIFAAALNCLSLEELRPCGFCRECTAFASGKSVDVREVDATSSNGMERVKALLKNVASAPSFSRFKIFIIDECHMLVCETWTALLKSLEEPPGHVVFIFITTDPDKLPRTAVSRCQKYLFPKIKESEIVSRLQKLAVEENLDVDTDALDLIAMKSDGSLRDAETMLDQLSLLGQRITLSLVHELVGVVSDEKLLDLLDLALSADTASTVRRARELISSGIEPMDLMAQLATLIMDILAGSCKLGDYKCKGIFFHRHALTEEDLERLRRALRILSEAEKQLRASNDQTTWLTAALLQFGPGRSLMFPKSAGTSVIQSPIALKNRTEKGLLYFDSPARQMWDKEKQSEAQLECLDSMTVKKRRTSNRNGGFTSTERVEGSPLNMDNIGESGQTELTCIKTNKLDDIWRKTIEECRSSTLRQLLHTEGKLVSVSEAEGLAIAQLEFWHPDHISRAERSWKSIANSLQHVLGCNVEVRINLGSLPAETGNIKCRKGSTEFTKSSISGQKKRSSVTAEEGRHQLQIPVIDSEQRMHGETFKKTHYVANGSQLFPEIPHGEAPTPMQGLQAVNMTERSNQNSSCRDKQEGSRILKDAIPDEQRLKSAWSQGLEKCASGLSDIIKPEKEQVHSQDVIDFQNGIASYGNTVMIPLGAVLQKKEGMENSKRQATFNLHNDVQKQQSARSDDPHISCSSSLNHNSFAASFEDENLACGSGSESGGILCWKTPKYDQAKLQRRRQWRKSGLLMWVVPCANSKK